MQKTIIVIQGFPNVGKSQTIRRAFDELRSEGSVIALGKGTKEVRGGILEIDAVRVGFISRGDVADDLEDDLNGLIRENCAVVVCAVRARIKGTSKTFKVVTQCAQQAEPPFTIKVIEKPADADSDAGNRKKVREIKAAVRRAVAAARH